MPHLTSGIFLLSVFPYLKLAKDGLCPRREAEKDAPDEAGVTNTDKL